MKTGDIIKLKNGSEYAISTSCKLDDRNYYLAVIVEDTDHLVLLEENNNEIKLVNDKEKVNEVIKSMLRGTVTSDN